MRHYRSCGLEIESEMELPGVFPSATLAGQADVTMRRTGQLDDLPAATIRGPNWAMDGDRFFLRVPGIARFLMSAGRDIAMCVEPGVDEGDAVAFLLGSAFGILLHQRGHLLLHASAVSVGGKAMLFCGPSGAGKSTMAAALGAKGYAHVNDDLCSVSISASGVPTIAPDSRMLKLWADAVAHIDAGGRKGEPVRKAIEKFYVSPSKSVVESALPVAAVYMLREESSSRPCGVERLSAVDAAQYLRRNAFRPMLMVRMGLAEEFFVGASHIQRHAGIFLLTRPSDLAALPDSVSRLEAHWRERGYLA